MMLLLSRAMLGTSVEVSIDSAVLVCWAYATVIGDSPEL